jgi:glucans biosynthesis protein
VELVEIPSKAEVNDNMVAFWRPHDPLHAKGEYLRNYRLHWCWAPSEDTKLGRVLATRCGLAWQSTNRLFIIDFAGETLDQWKGDTPPTIDSGCSKGKLVEAIAQRLPEIKGWRVSLQLDAQNNNLVDLHVRLMDNDKPLTETWIYRWTPS